MFIVGFAQNAKENASAQELIVDNMTQCEIVQKKIAFLLPKLKIELQSNLKSDLYIGQDE